MPALTETRQRTDEPVVPGTGHRLRADPSGSRSRRRRRSCGPSRPVRKLFDAAAEETKEAGSTVVPGSTAFVLHDTQGFPIDLTLEMAAEAGLTVDTDEFRRLMQEQRERARADAKARKGKFADLSASTGRCWTPAAPNSPATPSWSPRPPSAG